MARVGPQRHRKKKHNLPVFANSVETSLKKKYKPNVIFMTNGLARVKIYLMTNINFYTYYPYVFVYFVKTPYKNISI